MDEQFNDDINNMNRQTDDAPAPGTEEENSRMENTESADGCSDSGSGIYRMTHDQLRETNLYAERRDQQAHDQAGACASDTPQSDAQTGSEPQNEYSYYNRQSDAAQQSASGNNYGYYEDNTKRTAEEPDRRSGKKPLKNKNSFGMKMVKAVSLGLVFGLVAGAAFVGVNKAAGTGTSSASANNNGMSVNIVKTSAANTALSDSQEVSEVVKAVMPSIVAVNTTIESTSTDWFGRQYKQEGSGAGSGIIISEADGTLYILTNYHVVEDSTSVSIVFNDGSAADAVIRGYDSDADIAVLTIDMNTLSSDTKNAIAVAVIGDSDDLEAGNGAIAIGNALGYGQSVTSGIISAVNREVALTDGTMTLVQTTAAINPGNSGGALLNAKGEVIGVNTIKYSDTTVEGMGFAIPINSAIETAKGIIDGTIVAKTDENTAYLGITGGTLDESTASQYGAPAGVYVSSVESGSAAERAGLTSGCIITGFNGTDITTMDELQELLDDCVPGDSVDITASFQDNDGSYTEKNLTTILGAKSDYTSGSSGSDSSGSGSSGSGSGSSGSSGSGIFGQFGN